MGGGGVLSGGSMVPQRGPLWWALSGALSGALWEPLWAWGGV